MKLKRNPDKIKSCLKKTNDGALVATKDMKVQIPVSFAESGLAKIGSELLFCGICAYIVEDEYYAISMLNAMVRSEPSATVKVMHGDDAYYEFHYKPGDKVFSTLSLLKNNVLTYLIYNELVAKAHVPWYLSYDDMAKLFDTAKYHAGANIGERPEITELIISIIARNSKDMSKYYREVVTSYDDLDKAPPEFISMRSVQYAATNTTNKLGGSYFSEGVVSALANPSSRRERIEDLLMR